MHPYIYSFYWLKWLYGACTRSQRAYNNRAIMPGVIQSSGPALYDLTVFFTSPGGLFMIQIILDPSRGPGALYDPV